MRACSGVWIAHGSGSADRDTVDKHDHIAVPPDAPAYQLRRVWLTPEEEAGYYNGFANEGLWPLCHIAHVRPTFRSSDFEHVSRGEREVRGRGQGGGEVRRSDRAGAGLSLRAAAAHDPRPAAARDDHHVLAHPVAEPRGVRDLPVAGRAARRHARQQHPRLPHAVPLQQLPRHRRPHARGARRPRDVRRSRSAAGCTVVHRYPISIEWPPDPLVRKKSVADARNDVRERLRPSAGSRARHRRRASRLHEGHPRALPRRRAPARPRAAMDRQVHVRADRRALARDDRRLSGLRAARARGRRRGQRTLPAAPSTRRSSCSSSITSPNPSTSTSAPPTCASCPACTTA